MARYWVPTLTDIRNIFAGSGGPNNLGAYYRNGSYVPDNSANASIATSGSIGMYSFNGCSNLWGYNSASYYSSSCSRTSPGSCTASVGIGAVGVGGGGSYSYTWYQISGGMSLNNAYAQYPTVSYAHAVDGMSYASTWQCLITDADSITFWLPYCTVEFWYNQNY